MQEMLSSVVNPCHNCGTQRAYYRYDEKYWPWDRVERCAKCNLEWVCVGTPEGPGIAIVGVDKVGLRPTCPNCNGLMYYQVREDSLKCKECGYIQA